MRRSPSGRAALGVLVVVAGGLLGAGCSGSPAGPTSTACGLSKPVARAGPPASTANAESWAYPNADLANTRDALDSTISSADVSKLKPDWTFKLTGRAAASVHSTGSLAANPIVQAGVVYLQDLDSNVYALTLATGRLLWEYRCNQPVKSGPGPNGVAVLNGMVYGQTPTSAFALDSATGRKIWANGHLLSRGEGTFGIQPVVASGRVYLASQYGSGPGGGVLLALNASTGKLLWKFNTVNGPEPGVRALGVGSGGAWETPLVSNDGSVTFGTGNPYQTPAEAAAHPTRDLYTNSVVNLDAATGKLRWYYQAVPDDFKDYDLQTSPISAKVNGVPAVIDAGKMGYVYALNAKNGTLIWKTPVGEHNGHDNDSARLLEHKISLKAPYTILPGSLGGILANLALGGDSVYVVTCDVPLTYTSLSTPLPTKVAGPTGGQVEALDLATGKIEWDTKVSQLPLGAATVSNDLVFTTLYKGVLIALNRRTGAIVYRRQLPASTNAPIAIAGNAVIVPAGAPRTASGGGGPQVIAYTVR